MSEATTVRLRDLGEWVGGNTPSKANAAYWTNGTIPWVSPKDMKVDEIASSEDRVTEAALAEGRVSMVPEGSVLLVTRSGILAHTLPVAVTKLPVTINQDLKALTPKAGVSPKYVAHAVRGAGRRILKQCSKHGTTVASIETNALLDFEIPIVELDEQHRIVTEIEKQFSRLDRAVEGLRAVQMRLQHYRSAILFTACNGLLISRRGPWRRTVLGELLQSIEAGKSFKCVERPPTSSEVGVVKVSAVTWGEYDEDESKTCGDTGRLDERFLIRPEDFLFSRANTIELVGACVIAKRITRRVMLSDKILRFWFSSEVDPRWVLFWLRSRFGRTEIERLATGNQESMRNIGQDRIRQIAIDLPSLAEQRFIVSEVEHRFSVIGELMAEVGSALSHAMALRSSVLARWFSSPKNVLQRIV